MEPLQDLKAGARGLQALKKDSPGGVALLLEEKRKERPRPAPGSLLGIMLWPVRAVVSSLGRALLPGPKMLMVDELSLGLAPVVVQQLFQLLKEINRDGTTVLLVEQYVNQA